MIQSKIFSTFIGKLNHTTVSPGMNIPSYNKNKKQENEKEIH